jgi:RNA polymerase sigma-70 factor (ECF subfamily)
MAKIRRTPTSFVPNSIASMAFVHLIDPGNAKRFLRSMAAASCGGRGWRTRFERDAMGDAATDEAELAMRARAGCVASFAVLAARHQVAIVHYVAWMLGRGGRARCDAEDVAQQTFLRAFRDLEAYRCDGPFAAWLFAIARRTCLNHLRGERRRAARLAALRPADVDPAPGPDEVASAAERRRLLWGLARRTLPERQFTALWLHYVEALPVAGIALVLDRSPAAVKLLLLRGRRRLEPVLAEFASASIAPSCGREMKHEP